MVSTNYFIILYLGVTANHHQENTKKTRKNFTCDLCPNKLSNEDTMNRHMKIAHPEFVQLIWQNCQICADCFPNQIEFMKHKCLKVS